MLSLVVVAPEGAGEWLLNYTVFTVNDIVATTPPRKSVSGVCDGNDIRADLTGGLIMAAVH